MKNRAFTTRAAALFRQLGKPFRLRILLAIGEGEVCVCHLETVLGKRQAYISQHLMALRKAGLLKTRREGKYIFYRLSDPGLFSLVQQAGRVAGMAEEAIPEIGQPEIVPDCCCPHCQRQKNRAADKTCCQ